MVDVQKETCIMVGKSGGPYAMDRHVGCGGHMRPSLEYQEHVVHTLDERTAGTRSWKGPLGHTKLTYCLL